MFCADRLSGINDSLVFLAAGFGNLGAGPLFAAGDYGAISLLGLCLSITLLVLIFWRSRQPLPHTAP